MCYKDVLEPLQMKTRLKKKGKTNKTNHLLRYGFTIHPQLQIALFRSCFHSFHRIQVSHLVQTLMKDLYGMIIEQNNIEIVDVIPRPIAQIISAVH